ncbi:MAG: SpoIIE family protein phosphatase, partial [Elusimicrobiales bacterium]|nr:SpoIIE family protein phosphatase [Elusimicrobiales bacterium]
TLQLYPGDSVFLYTDGITEAENEKNELFGGKRLSGILNSEKRKNAWDICLSVKRSVKDFAGKAPQSDDITMLAFIYRGQNSQADK